jgi:hypothetical protein
VTSRKRIWSVVWRLAVCVALLGWICHTIFVNEGMAAARREGLAWESLTKWAQWKIGWQYGPPELWRQVRLVPTGTFIISAFVMGLTLLLGILRWRMVLRVHGLDLSWGRAGEISFVAHFFNSFLLGSTGGDLMKAYYAARETHHKKAEAVVTVFADRLIGFWAMLLFAGAMMLPNYNLLLDEPRLRVLGAVILAMLAGCTGVLVLAFWGGVSKAWSGAHGWLRRLPKGDLLERLLESCRHFGRSPAFLLRTLLISMVLNAACVLQVWILSRGLGLEVPPQVLAMLVPVIICISALPITPSGLGVRENLYVFTLASPSLGVAATPALSVSLLAYAGSLCWSLVGAGVYLLFKEKHHLREPELEAKGEGE